MKCDYYDFILVQVKPKQNLIFKSKPKFKKCKKMIWLQLF